MAAGCSSNLRQVGVPGKSGSPRSRRVPERAAIPPGAKLLTGGGASVPRLQCSDGHYGRVEEMERAESDGIGIRCGDAGRVPPRPQ
jgi:hypothetical protein